MGQEDRVVDYVIHTGTEVLRPCAELAAWLARVICQAAKFGIKQTAGKIPQIVTEFRDKDGLIDLKRLVSSTGQPTYIPLPDAFSDMEEDFNRIAKELGIKLALYADPVSGAKTLVFHVEDAQAINSLMTLLLRRMGFDEGEARTILDPKLGDSLEDAFTFKGVEFKKSADGAYRAASHDDEGGTIAARIEQAGDNLWRWTVEHTFADGQIAVEEHECHAEWGIDEGSAFLSCCTCMKSHEKAAAAREEHSKYPHTSEQRVAEEQAKDRTQSRARDGKPPITKDQREARAKRR